MESILYQAALNVDEIRRAQQHCKQCRYETGIFNEKIPRARAALRAARAKHGADSWEVHVALMELASLAQGLDTLRRWRRMLDKQLRRAPSPRRHVPQRSACRVRVNRHARSRRPLRAAAKKTVAKAADDPGGGEPPGPQVPTVGTSPSNSSNTAPLGGAPCW